MWIDECNIAKRSDLDESQIAPPKPILHEDPVAPVPVKMSSSFSEIVNASQPTEQQDFDFMLSDSGFDGVLNDVQTLDDIRVSEADDFEGEALANMVFDEHEVAMAIDDDPNSSDEGFGSSSIGDASPTRSTSDDIENAVSIPVPKEESAEKSCVVAAAVPTKSSDEGELTFFKSLFTHF